MNRNESAQLSHQRCVELLPAYINGRLKSSERRAVQQHTAQCEACFQALQDAQDVRDKVRQTPPGLTDLLSDPVRERNLAKTLDLIELDSPWDGEASAREGVRKSNNVVAPSRWRRDWKNSPSTIRRVLVAQAACLLAVVSLLVLAPSVPLNYTTLSEPQTRGGSALAPGYQVYRLVFHPATTESDIRNLMSSVQGQIISGPSPSGVYSVAVLHNDQQDSLVLESLRRSPWIRLAEPAIHSDGAVNE